MAIDNVPGLSGPMLKRIRELESTIRWALGENGEFRQREEGEGAYWWRKELRRRAFPLRETEDKQ